MANQAVWNKTKFCVGDTIAVQQKVKEGGKERVQIFEGIVIAIKGGGSGRSFVVRKLSGGVGVERIWPILCPSLVKIQVKRKGQVRRAKLYYLRKNVGKTALKTKEKKNEQQSAQKSEPKKKEVRSVRGKISKNTSSR